MSKFFKVCSFLRIAAELQGMYLIYITGKPWPHCFQVYCFTLVHLAVDLPHSLAETALQYEFSDHNLQVRANINQLNISWYLRCWQLFALPNAIAAVHLSEYLHMYLTVSYGGKWTFKCWLDKKVGQFLAQVT